MISETPMQTQIFQLCSDDFLNQLPTAILHNAIIVPWSRKYGAKDNLFFTQSDCFSITIVDADLCYSQHNILSWIRTVYAGGLLILEALPYQTYKLVENACSSILEYIPNENKNIWLFRKKVSPNDNAMSHLIIDWLKMQAENKLSDDDLLAKLQQLEQIDPYAQNTSLLALITKLRIYEKYNLTQLAANECQRVIDINPTPHSYFLAVLSKISYSNNFYQQGFDERRSIIEMKNSLVRSQFPPQEKIFHKRWQGQAINNKTIVIWCEFGFGDQIMFAQLAHYFKQQHAKKVIFVAEQAISKILSSSLDIDEIIPAHEANHKLDRFDYWTYIHDILIYIPQPFSQLNLPSPYLFINNKNKFKKFFTKTEKLKIGIVWKGNPTHENDQLRSIHNMQYLEPLFNLPNIQWFAIQQECNELELDVLNKYQIPHLGNLFQDFTDTAIALKNLDYLVTVDTAVAHLAGALGVPTLLLLPYIVDWRWGLSQKNNDWYPNMLSFRCPLPLAESWQTAIEELSQYLLNLSQ